MLSDPLRVRYVIKSDGFNRRKLSPSKTVKPIERFLAEKSGTTFDPPMSTELTGGVLFVTY